MKNKVFENFKSLTKVPRGSGNTVKIADYCVDFAKRNNLEFLRDAKDNVIIFKDGAFGGKNKKPVILQGHTDMVCQQTADSNHDFTKEGPRIIVDGDYLKANKTTLGADNGIALALIMAILESDDISHPPIEAVFTSDEEIGMLGASALDMSSLKSKRMINLDSEEDDTVTGSCAGGSDFLVKLPIEFDAYSGKAYNISFFGLKGGHSGVEIDKGRVNANVLAGRFLNHFAPLVYYRLCEINGGDKSNAITLECSFKLVTNDKNFKAKAEEYLKEIKSEISAREPDFNFEISETGDSQTTFSKALTDKIVFLLVNAPSGIIDMSAEIKGLVETSLNLGILKTEKDSILFDFSFRSNKLTAMKFLEERLSSLANSVNAKTETIGFYPPWEYMSGSDLEKTYCECYERQFGKSPKISAIHAGLECGVFASKIEGLSAISVGPQMFDVHTVNERLSISSTEKFVELIKDVLANLG